MTRTKPRANARHIKGMLMLANTADLFEGQQWYQRAYDLALRLVHAYEPINLGQAIGVIAALSPNNKWERNCQDAEQLIKAWHCGADMDAVKVCTFNTNKAKAWRILCEQETDPLDVLSGRKVRAFYRCISGYNDSVCIDGHAYAIFVGERVPTTQTPSIGKALYAAIERSYVLAAQSSYDLCGHVLTPAQVQAVTWVTYRRLIQEAA